MKFLKEKSESSIIYLRIPLEKKHFFTIIRTCGCIESQIFSFLPEIMKLITNFI